MPNDGTLAGIRNVLGLEQDSSARNDFSVKLRKQIYFSLFFVHFSRHYVSSLLIFLNNFFSCRYRLEHDMVDSKFSKLLFPPKIKVKLHDMTDLHRYILSFAYAL